MIERKVYDPYTMDYCHDLLCEHSAQVACPECGWTYCSEHWDLRMRVVHERMHAENYYERQRQRRAAAR